MLRETHRSQFSPAPEVAVLGMRCSGIGGVRVCPPKAKVTRSNRVGRAISFQWHERLAALLLRQRR